MTEIKLHQTHKVAGYYTLKKYSAEGELLQELGPFDNLITDIGLNRIGTNSPITNCYIGSGTTPAAVTDTSMGAFLATTTTVNSTGSSDSGGSPYWESRSRTYRFSSFASPTNVTEVGVGWNSTGASALWSRALTVDTMGAPVTISVLAGEILDVTYTLRYYPPNVDSTYDVTIASVDYTFSSRSANIQDAQLSLSGDMRQALRVTCYGGPCALGAVTGSITGATSSASAISGSVPTYVDGTDEMSYTVSFSVAQGNVTGGITGLYVEPSTGTTFAICSIQMTVSPAIPKDNTKSMTFTFYNSWDRY